MAANIY